MTKEVPEEAEMGALADEDEVSGAVGEVGGGRQAFGTAGTRAAHPGGVDGDKLSVDHAPTAATIWKTVDLVKHIIVCVICRQQPLSARRGKKMLKKRISISKQSTKHDTLTDHRLCSPPCVIVRLFITYPRHHL